jgi:hypothetical protein
MYVRKKLAALQKQEKNVTVCLIAKETLLLQAQLVKDLRAGQTRNRPL